jgi:hypothetical protein
VSVLDLQDMKVQGAHAKGNGPPSESGLHAPASPAGDSFVHEAGQVTTGMVIQTATNRGLKHDHDTRHLRGSRFWIL